MKEFIYTDASALASGESVNILTIHAVNPIAADKILKRLYSLDRLDKFGRVSFATANWTNTTKTLTLTGAFTRYVFANSTRIILVSGTGIVAGEYVVASRTSDNAIVLTADIALTPGDLSNSDIVGYIIGGRTATRYERTNDTTLSGLPNEGSNEAGSGLNKGVSPSRMIPGLVNEVTVSAA